MIELVIFIVVALAVFGSVMWIFLCLNSGRFSKEENEREYKRACARAKEILKRRHNGK